MKRLKNGTTIEVTERSGQVRQIGHVQGETFVAFRRDEERHLFRGGSETAQDARENGTAAWGLDLSAMRQLHENHGIQYVEIPTARGTYRAKMETVIGPKSFQKEFSGHRVQTFLPLGYWTLTRGDARKKSA